ncbi:putative disease resistance protein At1g50180 [Vitis riparia]|uniref:putative disease resistance protein At1g50180 n=1 Tax=Vitis riparia TaxID=96939 RepID=UPI00155A12AC|nr:putative disease resistance protein At1g50180 [Vitis riparia]
MANIPKQRSHSCIHNMEETIDSCALGRLTDLLIQEAKLLHGVTGEVEEIQTELRRMQGFLKVADARQDEDKAVISSCIAEIREAAYDAEDVIETFAFRVALRGRSGFLNILKRCACIFSELIAPRKVGTEIEAIKQRISTTTARLETYDNVNRTEGRERSSSRDERQPRFNDEETVGVEDSVKILVEQLVKPDKRCSVVSIWGMGGLGKTTLARKVYHHVDVRRHFDCYAWCSISQHCNIRGVVEGLLIKLTSSSEEQIKKIEKMRDEELFKRAYEIQKEKKCLVILDDVWRMEDWECLRPAFPLLKEGSKILLTTRIQAVALHVDPQHHFLCQPKLLSAEESWKLLQRKAFPSYKAIGPSRQAAIFQDKLAHGLHQGGRL